MSANKFMQPLSSAPGLEGARILPYLGLMPCTEARVFVAPGACLIGGVTLREDASVFFNCVLRGDINTIEVGRGSNVQDNSVLHVASDLGVKIGEHVSIGHSCIIHACTLADRILVGMGSIVMDGAEIGSDCIIAAGSLVPKGKSFPSGSLIMGSPAKVVRALTPEEIDSVAKLALKYIGVKNDYL